jgi:hypothetical protein
MHEGRSNNTATLLLNGRVLIAGNPAAAELYDPTTGNFTMTGSLALSRAGATATLLDDGRVLIAGGNPWSEIDPYFACGAGNSAELYDPSTGTFIPTGSMTTARAYHTATRLDDGRVLIAGGYDCTHYAASAELYDPKSGTFSATGSMAQARYGDTATPLLDGRVLIAGGSSGYPHPGFASAELYDPATGNFTATGSMTDYRQSATATRLVDGRVLIAGGRGWQLDLMSAELYDPASGTFALTGAMTIGRIGHTATLLPDGRVLVAGGGLQRKSAELYEPVSGTFSPTGSMSYERDGSMATALADGRVLVAGGSYCTGDGCFGAILAELYQPPAAEQPTPPQTPHPSPTPGNLSVTSKHRSGTDKATKVHWDFTEPVVATPGSQAGARISADIEKLLNSRTAYMVDWVGPGVEPAPGFGAAYTNLSAAFVVVAATRPAANLSGGFVTIRIDYIVDTNWIADAGPQWVDFLSYDLSTGKRISISALFTVPDVALQRLSIATANSPVITQWWDYQAEQSLEPDQTVEPQPYADGYAPMANNFAMWAPTPSGLQITFAAYQVSAAVDGTPSIIVPWADLRDLVKPNSYLAWYLATLP